MRQEISSTEDIAALSRKFLPDSAVPTDEPPARKKLSIAEWPDPSTFEANIDFLIEGILPKGCITAFTGLTGCGKSTLATALARDLNAQDVPVMVLDRENPQAVVKSRMQRLKYTGGPLLRYAGIWLDEVPEPNAGEVIEWVRQSDPKPLVIVDSMVRFFDGGDENSAKDMAAFMGKLTRLKALGATIILIHHSGKAETSQDYRGSSDFGPALDHAFSVKNVPPAGKPGELGKLYLRQFKYRCGDAGPVSYDYAGGDMIRDTSPHVMAKSVTEQLRDLLRENPGVTKVRFGDLAQSRNLGRDRGRGFLDDGITDNPPSVRMERGNHNKHGYYLIEESIEIDGNYMLM